MRDEHVGVGVVVEVVFEPVAGFEVEVVGGLVEQQKRRFLEEEFRERDAHLPAAGELFGFALPVFLGEAEAAEDGADLRVEVVDVVVVELVGDVGVALGGAAYSRDLGSASERTWVRAMDSASISWRWSKTERHSAKTVLPRRARPSCGR